MDKKSSKLAITSLVIGLIGMILLTILLSPLAIIFGILAIVAINRSSETLKGKGIAISGITLGTIGVIFAIAQILLFPPPFQERSYKITSTSMVPTLKPADRIIGNAKSYVQINPERGDIVVFYPPISKKPFVFRIIGLPGEELVIKKGTIYINGEKITNPDIAQFYYYNQGEYGKENKEVVIPQDEYFVLGDNSLVARDSRFWGFVDEENIVGKVKYRWFPFNQIKKFE
ncbi:MAG: signal peptidase I [Candidatus Omnitrophica bacterium]|nr:signal peptidase I [Candidatus Omnitrophota bacterium]